MTAVLTGALAASVFAGGCAERPPVARRTFDAGGLAGTHATGTVGVSVEHTGSAVALAEPPLPRSSIDVRPKLGTDFDVDAAMRHVRRLADGFGVREAGSEAERRTAEYVAGELRLLGYEPRIETFPLADGRTSRNVVAVKAGRSATRLIIGAHMDSKAPSPGANDDATGVGVVLAVAEALADEPTDATIEFVAYGSEEAIDSDPDHHHYGSRFRVSRMTAEELQATVAMFSVDMVGYGSAFHARTMRRGPQTLADDVIAFARERGVGLTFRRDEGRTGWSDHEAYELAGIPAVWLEWRDDPVYHTPNDTSGHITVEKVRVTGQLVLDYARALDAEAAERLRRR